MAAVPGKDENLRRVIQIMTQTVWGTDGGIGVGMSGKHFLLEQTEQNGAESPPDFSAESSGPRGSGFESRHCMKLFSTNEFTNYTIVVNLQTIMIRFRLHFEVGAKNTRSYR